MTLHAEPLEVDVGRRVAVEASRRVKHSRHRQQFRIFASQDAVVSRTYRCRFELTLFLFPSPRLPSLPPSLALDLPLSDSFRTM
jgi:hypothetical protein